MISKKRLLQAIDAALGTEEHLIGIYASHCAIAVDLASGDTAGMQPLRKTVMRLRDESRGHRQTLTELRQALMKDDRDAY